MIRNPFARLVVVLGLALAIAQGKDLPRGTYELKDLEQAKAKALASKKWIAYLYTDKDTDCPLCQDAASEFVDAVGNKAVLVYLPSPQNKTFWNGLSEEMRQALSVGRMIPTMVVTHPENGSIVSSIHYESFKEDGNKALRAFKKALTADKK